MYRKDTTEGVYVTCCLVNASFMVVRICFHLYEYLRLFFNPYLMDLSWTYSLAFYTFSAIWSGFLFYSNYVFFSNDLPEDAFIVLAFLLLIFYGYKILIEGMVFYLILISLLIVFIFFSEYKDESSPLEDVIFYLLSRN